MTDRDLLNLSKEAACLYEQDIVPTIMQPYTASMFERVILNAGERVLDVACGTGIVVRLAVEKFGNIARISGVDINSGMLEIARAHAPATSIPVEWRESDMCELPFPDASFDVVLCQQGLQFVPDKLAALREVRRVLTPKGRLAFTVWSEVSPYAAALSEALAHHISAETAASSLTPFQFREVKMIEDLVEDAGFREVTMQELVVFAPMPASVEGIIADTKRRPFARDVAAASEASRQAFGQEMSTALKAYYDGDKLSIPLKSHLVQARKP